MNIKKQPSKKIMEKSNSLQKRKSTTLVVNTSHDTSFDSRWAQVKIEGKNISGRSNHVAVVFASHLYVHGGYDVDKGLLSDFHKIQLSEDTEEYIWKAVTSECDGTPIKLKNHTAVAYKDNMFVFGGESHTNKGSNTLYIFNFITQKWTKKQPNINIPKLDSHVAVLHGSNMYIFGGYISEKAQYLKSIYCLDLEKLQWSIEYSGGTAKEQPEGRSNLTMVPFDGCLWIFGGTNGVHTLKDMWKYDLKTKKWIWLDAKDTPDARRGHSMIVHQNLMFMFGGIQDITKEKNDVYIFEPNKLRWSKIHTTTNSIYDCSPTLKKQRKSQNKNADRIQIHRISPEKNSEKGSDAMKKILNENKQKKFLERKRELLKQFSQKPADFAKNRALSPTTESMLKTLEAIGNQESSKKELRQQIMYDQSHRFIIGKKPCARDGQSVSLYNNKMFIFGGDRHLMAFNDLYSFDLEKGVKSLQLYQST